MLVALTRELGHNDELRSLVPARTSVIEIPLTSTRYRELDDVRHELAATPYVGSYRVLVVTSARSARYASLAREALGASATIVCVGPATSKKLREHGVACDYVGSSGVLDVDCAIEAGPVLILGAARMREELMDSLRQRHLAFTTLACYETVANVLSDDQKDRLARSDVVFVGAPSAWAVARSVVRLDAWVVVAGDTTATAVRQTHPRVIEGWNDAARDRLAKLAATGEVPPTRGQ